MERDKYLSYMKIKWALTMGAKCAMRIKTKEKIEQALIELDKLCQKIN